MNAPSENIFPHCGTGGMARSGKMINRTSLSMQSKYICTKSSTSQFYF